MSKTTVILTAIDRVIGIAYAFGAAALFADYHHYKHTKYPTGHSNFSDWKWKEETGKLGANSVMIILFFIFWSLPFLSLIPLMPILPFVALPAAFINICASVYFSDLIYRRYMYKPKPKEEDLVELLDLICKTTAINKDRATQIKDKTESEVRMIDLKFKCAEGLTGMSDAGKTQFLSLIDEYTMNDRPIKELAEKLIKVCSNENSEVLCKTLQNWSRKDPAYMKVKEWGHLWWFTVLFGIPGIVLSSILGLPYV